MARSDREEKGTVTIKGVDKEVYRALVSLAKLWGKTAGELATQAFKLYLSITEAVGGAISSLGRALERAGDIISRTGLQVVSGIGRLELDKATLEAAEKPLLLMGIKRLAVRPDVEPELLREKVMGIVDCEVVEVPPGPLMAEVLKKCRFVGEVAVLEEGEEGRGEEVLLPLLEEEEEEREQR